MELSTSVLKVSGFEAFQSSGFRIRNVQPVREALHEAFACQHPGFLSGVAGGRKKTLQGLAQCLAIPVCP